MERSASAVYAVTNHHTAPVSVELLVEAPVSRNEKIVVRSSYDPQPASTEWDHRPGVAAWNLPLAPGQTQRVQIKHVVSYPKDARVTNLP